MTMKVIRNTNDGVTYASSVRPDYTVRIKNSKQSKNLNGVSTTNHATEIIVNDLVPVVLGGVAANDALSVRVRTSCAIESRSRLSAVLTALVADLAAFDGDDVFVGFLPEDPPTEPTV